MLGKNFKKLLALLLTLAMIFSLCACGKPAGGGGDDDEGSSQQGGNQGDNQSGNQGGGSNIDPNKMTDKELMLAVEQQSLQGAVGVLMEVLKAAESGDISMDSMGAELDITIRPSAQLVQLLQSSFLPQGSGLDLSALEKIGLDLTTNMSGDMTRILAGLSINGQKLADVDMIMDMATASMWIALPGLADQYLDITQLYSAESAPADRPNSDMMSPYESMSGSGQAGMAAIAMPTEIIELLPEIMPDPEKLEPLLNKYIGVMLNAIEDVKRENIVAELDGKKQNAIKLTYTITEENLAKMILAVMKAAKDDADLKVVVDQLSVDLTAVATKMGSEFDTDLWQELQAFLTSGIEYFESLTEFGEGNNIVITTTLDSSNNVIGRSFKLLTENVDELYFAYLTVTEGNTQVIDVIWNAYSRQYEDYDWENDEPTFVNVKQEVSLKGSATLSGGKVTGGTYNLFFASGDTERKLLTVELSNMTETSGTITIVPAADLMKLLFGSNIEMSAALKLIATEEKLTIELLVDGERMIGIDLSGKQTTPAAVQKPTNIFDATNSSISNWLNENAITKLLDNWKAAGMPEIVLPE